MSKLEIDRLEKSIERSFVNNIKKQGGLCFKWVSPGTRGVPDRLCFLPIKNEEHKKIVNSYVVLTELKTKKGSLSPHQEKVKKDLERIGYIVNKIKG